MESKKNPKANLQKKRPVYFQLGLILSTSLTLFAFEWAGYLIDKPEEKIGIVEDEIYVTLPDEVIIEEEQQEEVAEQPKQQELKDIFELDDDTTSTTKEAPVITVAPVTHSFPDSGLFVPQKKKPKIDFVLIPGVQPEFKGKLKPWLSRNIKYPKLAKSTGIQGKVYIQFIIEEDGSVSNAEVVRGIGGGCDEEALRIVNLMPKWEPGLQNYEPVRVRMTLPITFKLKY